MVLQQDVPGQPHAELLQFPKLALGHRRLYFIAAKLVSQHDFAVKKMLHRLPLHKNARRVELPHRLERLVLGRCKYVVKRRRLVVAPDSVGVVDVVDHLILVPQGTTLTDDEIFHAAIRALGHLPLEAKIELLVGAPCNDVTAAALGRVFEAVALDRPALPRELAASGVHPLIGRRAVEQRHKPLLHLGVFLFSRNWNRHNAGHRDGRQQMQISFHFKM